MHTFLILSLIFREEFSESCAQIFMKFWDRWASEHSNRIQSDPDSFFSRMPAR